MSGLSIVTLIAFDYRYAFDAIRYYYAMADEIILGVDCDRLSWSRQHFDIDMGELRAFISNVDAAHKIRIIEGNFHVLDHPMANETRERSLLARQCAAGNRVVQIDADEIVLNGAEFLEWLNVQNATGLVLARWISVFKLFGEQALVVNPAKEMTPVATWLHGDYCNARWTRERQVASPLQLLHLSWGRRPEEVLQKLKNWGHARDFDVDAFYRLWDSVTLENYQNLRDFHPIHGPAWPGLSLIKLHWKKTGCYEQSNDVSNHQGQLVHGGA